MTFRRIAADFYQRIHEQMHCKSDLVAREVAEEIVDRVASFIAPKLSAVPYAILDKKRGDSVGIIAIVAVIPISRLENLNFLDVFDRQSTPVPNPPLSPHFFLSSRNRDKNSFLFSN